MLGRGGYGLKGRCGLRRGRDVDRLSCAPETVSSLGWLVVTVIRVSAIELLAIVSKVP